MLLENSIIIIIIIGVHLIVFLFGLLSNIPL